MWWWMLIWWVIQFETIEKSSKIKKYNPRKLRIAHNWLSLIGLCQIWWIIYGEKLYVICRKNAENIEKMQKIHENTNN